jgi:predicted GNAT family N-acyltransferase
MESIDIRVIAHGSAEYESEVELRHLILRQSLGLSFSAEELLAEENSHHIGCYSDGKLVGCLVLKPITEKQIQMRQVAVDKAVQGKGIGKRMVVFSEAVAENLGFSEMILNARETAVPFYETLSYVKAGEGFTEVTIPHWSMSKILL